MRRHDPMPTNTRIPAGYTYLGQFVDHDITFDPVSRLDRAIDPHALTNFRTPRLDLDSVYGAGPVVQPYLYDWLIMPPATRMLIGHHDGIEDLPRNEQGRALIGDARNDEHAIVAQLHLLFLRFHNAVADRLAAAGLPDEDLLGTAQDVVRRHYGWIVEREFLPLLTGIAHADAQPVSFDDGPFIPIEFSGAVYRFGHSMVRPQYGLRMTPPGTEAPPATPLFPGLAGFGTLDPGLVVDWERFFRLPGFEREAEPSQRINTHITGPLFHLPEPAAELPRRNLQRGRMLGLPSGQDVARAMGVDVLDADELCLQDVPPDVLGELREATPLWFYVLAEAQARAEGKRLGPLGGRLVSGVLSGLLVADPTRDPDWRPGELGTGETFTMATLIEFTRAAAPA